ncbi:MAG TPA: biopolymer transporter ExbD [Limnobacter sp.]|uniref:ExbD/TolR family protein n=1 Tax=Limnobacter sp. TaxID=2003368 RepID=UPI002E302127|nr:biopolymer transporter ExbD [Limnobacter sp.]HEX5487159.1 biopolymer transporter ExbD [Limnobacter sp.]
MRLTRRNDTSTEPEINLIPLIDILLVIVIFLVISSTYVRQSQLKVDLPGTQNGETKADQSKVIRIRIARDGNYALGDQGVLSADQLRSTLVKALAETPAGQENHAIIEADAMATHQAVVTAMDMLAALGISRVSIATAQSR